MTGEVSRDSVIPAFVVALRAAVAPLLPAVTVDLAYTGSPYPGDYLWIHCEDPYSPGPAPGSTSSQVWAGAARATGRQESGDITCAIEAWNGEGDVTAAMTGLRRGDVCKLKWSSVDLAGGMIALVMAPDRVTHRIRPGAYLGQSDGRVTAVHEDRIELVELVPDGAGGWLERPAAIALEDQ